MKLTNYIFLITGLMILLNLAGIVTTGGYVLGTLNLASNPEGFASNSLFITIMAVFVVAAAGSVIIGLFAKAPVENLLIAPLLAFFGLFIGDLILILQVTNSYCNIDSSCRWVYYVTMIMIAPLIMGFTMSLIDWWRGRD